MTIKEVAKLAGVSSAAVSRYFNGGSLSDAKREQIRKCIDKCIAKLCLPVNKFSLKR